MSNNTAKTGHPEFWNNITSTEEAKGLILDAYLHGKPFEGWLYGDEFYPEKKDTTLDFGCGIGRNANALKAKFKSVDAFDLPGMITLMPDQTREVYSTVSSDWNEVKQKRYNCIHASLVFQHINEDSLRVYLKDMIKMSDWLLMASRTYLDDNKKNLMHVILEYYDIVVLNESLHKILVAPPEHEIHFVTLMRAKSVPIYKAAMK